jgi:hypothetical protein
MSWPVAFMLLAIFWFRFDYPLRDTKIQPYHDQDFPGFYL